MYKSKRKKFESHLKSNNKFSGGNSRNISKSSKSTIRKSLGNNLVFNKFGFNPKKEFSQNFLRSKKVIEEEVKIAAITRNDFVLEIGAGLGALTWEISKLTNQIVLVEIDRRFGSVLSKFSRKIVWADASEISVISKIRKFGNINKVISNLPYNKTLPIIFNLIEILDFDLGVFMMQKELALRLGANPNEPGYSRISVYIQSFARIKIVRDIMPGAFYPEPDVVSAIVKIKPYLGIAGAATVDKDFEKEKDSTRSRGSTPTTDLSKNSHKLGLLKAKNREYRNFLEKCFYNPNQIFSKFIKQNYPEINITNLNGNIQRAINETDVETFIEAFLKIENVKIQY